MGGTLFNFLRRINYLNKILYRYVKISDIAVSFVVMFVITDNFLCVL
jgi:hypothetical protein